jgi:hypothetical protein
MTEKDIRDIVRNLVHVDATKQYWFVRTVGGTYYNDFLTNNFVAIGYDEVKAKEIAYAQSQPKSQTALAAIIREHYTEHRKPRYIGNQLLDFYYGMAKGDVVIIPSEHSDFLSFGEVEDDKPFIGGKNDNVESPCPFQKRRKVKWVRKNVRISQLDPQFYRIRFVQRAITKIDAYAEGFVDREIYPLFVKESVGHLAINIRTNNPIKYSEFTSTWSDLFKLTEEYGKQEGLEIDTDEFDVRLNVQSPGTVEFITYSIAGIVVMAVIMTYLIGADFSFKSRATGEIKIKTDGFLKSLSAFLDKKVERKMKDELVNKLKNLNVEPTEIVKLLNQANNKSGPMDTNEGTQGNPSS